MWEEEAETEGEGVDVDVAKPTTILAVSLEEGESEKELVEVPLKEGQWDSDGLCVVQGVGDNEGVG